jgi:hypothetical protein
MPCSLPSRRSAAFIFLAPARTIGDPQWVKMAWRTPTFLHHTSCSMIEAWPIRTPSLLRTIERLNVAPSPM